MNPIEKILVPTDFSERSRPPLVEAVAWAEALDARLVLVHVTTTSYWPSLPPDPEFEGLDQSLRDGLESRLHAIRQDEVPAAIASEAHLLSGTPYSEIARFAEDAEVDLMILGTHGHSRLDRFFVGSTTERIVRFAPCSVMVLRDPEGAREPGLTGLSTILVATDFSEGSVAALERAVALATRANAEIVLLHVFRDADSPVRELVSAGMWNGVRRRSRQWLERLLEDHVRGAVPSRVLMVDGVPSAKIADVATELGADLVVLGSHGRSGLKQSQLGSTVERVVRVAPCSVYVERRGT